MHRFLTMAKREEAEVIHFFVNHHPRNDGKSKYSNLGRFIVGIYDIISVMWLMKRSPKIRY